MRDHDPKDTLRYRRTLHGTLIGITFFVGIGGFIAAMIIAKIGYKFLAAKFFWGGIIGAMITGTIAYMIPLFNFKKHIAYLEKRCTAKVIGRCTQNNERPTYQVSDYIKLMPYYSKPDDGTSDSAEHDVLYYDPEYTVEYDGQIYHLCEHLYSVCPIEKEGMRTLYIDPSSPDVFYDEHRYSMELKRAKENSRDTLSILFKFYFFVLLIFALYLFL